MRVGYAGAVLSTVLVTCPPDLCIGMRSLPTRPHPAPWILHASPASMQCLLSGPVPYRLA